MNIRCTTFLCPSQIRRSKPEIRQTALLATRSATCLWDNFLPPYSRESKVLEAILTPVDFIARCEQDTSLRSKVHPFGLDAGKKIEVVLSSFHHSCVLTRDSVHQWWPHIAWLKNSECVMHLAIWFIETSSPYPLKTMCEYSNREYGNRIHTWF